MSSPEGWSRTPSKGQPGHPTPRRLREPPPPTPARRADAQAPASASTNVVLRHDGAVRWDAPPGFAPHRARSRCAAHLHHAHKTAISSVVL